MTALDSSKATHQDSHLVVGFEGNSSAHRASPSRFDRNSLAMHQIREHEHRSSLSAPELPIWATVDLQPADDADTQPGYDGIVPLCGRHWHTRAAVKEWLNPKRR